MSEMVGLVLTIQARLTPLVTSIIDNSSSLFVTVGRLSRSFASVSLSGQSEYGSEATLQHSQFGNNISNNAYVTHM